MPTASAAAAAQFGSLELAYIDVGGHQIAPEHIPTSGITVAAWVKVDALDAVQEIFAARATACPKIRPCSMPRSARRTTGLPFARAARRRLAI